MASELVEPLARSLAAMLWFWDQQKQHEWFRECEEQLHQLMEEQRNNERP